MLLGQFVQISNSLVDVKNHTEKFVAEKSERFRKHGTSRNCVKDGESLWNEMTSI